MWGFIEDIFQDDIVKVIIAMFIGAVLGIEREYSGKSAGFRTIILICIGSTVFTILSVRLGAGSSDRIAANILTGVGFLGAGVIFRTEKRAIGLTTASTIWIAAALGMSIGSGHVLLAFLVTGLVLVVLLGFTVFQRFIEKASYTHTYKINLEYHGEYIDSFEDSLKKYNLVVKDQSHVRSGNEFSSIWLLHGKAENHQHFKSATLKDMKVKRFEF